MIYSKVYKVTNSVKLSELDQWTTKHKKMFNFGDIISVNGEMGYGKTTVIRHLIKSFASSLEATSPTFGLMDVHELDDNYFILHIDAYRIKDATEVFGLGLDHYAPTKTMIFIEWSQNIPSYILRPNNAIDIQLTDQVNTRIINII